MSLTSAIAECRRLLVQQEALAAVLSALERIGDLESATAEGERALAAVRGKVAAEHENLERMKADTIDGQARIDEAMALANTKVQEAIESAHVKADGIIAEAEFKCRAKLAAADNRLLGMDATEAASNEKVQKALAQVEAAEADAAAAKADVATQIAALAKAKADLAKLLAQE